MVKYYKTNPSSQGGELETNRSTLSLRDLHHFQELDSADEETLWLALGSLVDYLDDHLLLVEETRLPADHPHRLVVFSVDRPEHAQLYLVVTLSGVVIVGRADHLGEHTSMRLGDFDPLRHEITSVAVTSERLLGDSVDVWIGVRRSSTGTVEAPSTFAYHALIRMGENGQPRVEPARDDQPLADDNVQALPADRFPDWFRRWNVTTSGTQLRTELPQAAREAFEESQHGEKEITIVAWQGPRMTYATDDEVGLLCLEGTVSVPDPLRAPERVRALALVPGSSETIQGVTGLDARALMAFEATDGPKGLTLNWLWFQRRKELPTALGFLEKDSASAWPDLLVSYADGYLERLRCLGEEKAIRTAWDACWRKLRLESAPLRIAAAQRMQDACEAYRRVILVGVVERVLAESGSPQVCDRWLREVSALFRSSDSELILQPVVKFLLKALHRYGTGKAPPRPLAENSEDFLPALLYRIYDRCAPVGVRERIDRMVRTLSWRQSASADPYVKKLKERSKRSRIDIWEDEIKTIHDRIDHVLLGLERWASPYFVSDTVRLPETVSTHDATTLAPVCSRSGDEIERWLAFPDQSRIRLLPVGNRNKLGKHQEAPNLQCERPVAALKALSGDNGDRLLALERGGWLKLLEVRSGGIVHLLDRLDLGSRGRARALATCPLAKSPESPGDSLVAVVLGEEQRSSLALCTVQGPSLRKLRTEVADEIFSAQTVDVSSLGGRGYCLALGASQAAPLVFYHLDSEGRIVRKGPFREFESGVLAVRFSDAREPGFAAVGERNGLIRCADLRSEPGDADLAWIYQLDGAVRSLERASMDGERYFLAGSENGKFVLLQAEDGRRIWKGRLQESVRQIVAEERNDSAVFVLLRGRWVVVYSSLDKTRRDEAWTRVGNDLEALRASLDHARCPADADMMKAFRAITTGNANFAELLEKSQSRETRARIVRWLAQEAGTGLDLSEVISRLSFRDLTLLLNYLPDKDRRWDELIAEQIGRRKPQSFPGDNSERAALVAAVTLLQRIGRGHPTAASLASQWKLDRFLLFPWARLELARLLVQAIGRERRSQGPSEELFPYLALESLRWPPELVTAMATVVPYRSLLHGDLLALIEVMEALNQGRKTSAFPEEDLERLTRSFRAFLKVEDDDCSRLFTALLELHNSVTCNRQRNWSHWRSPALNALRELAECLFSYEDPEPPADHLVEALRNFISRRPLASDREPLEERVLAIERSKRRLEQPRKTVEERFPHHPWHRYIVNAIELTREAVTLLLNNEHSYLLHLVRPHIRRQIAELGDEHRLLLRLQTESEGYRHLNDVTIHFSATGESGLKAPGTREVTLNLLAYPGRFPDNELQLDGFIEPGQKVVQLKVEIVAEGSYRHVETWPLVVPKLPGRLAGRLALPVALPGIFRRFCEAVLECKAPVTVAVIDGDLGRDSLLSEFRSAHPGRVLDLDAELRPFGPGRKYGDRRLDLELIRETIRTALETADPWKEDATGATVSPFLIGPTNELIQRLLDGDGEHVLVSWLLELRSRMGNGGLRPLVVVLGSRHACQLRALGLESIPELTAHRIPGQFELSAQEQSENRREVLNLIEKEASLGTSAAGRSAETLGWDLRFILRWLRWLKEAPTTNMGVKVGDFLKTDKTRRLLYTELASLKPFELLCTMVGCETETHLELARVQPGHTAAREHRSSTRIHSAKLLIERGGMFTSTILGRLRSDRQAPSFLWIQGFGFAGTPESTRTRLLGVLQTLSRERREQSFQALSRRGIGTYIGSIFRTASPYRELIRTLYNREAADPERRDSNVYSAITGEDRFLAEILEPNEIFGLRPEELSNLMPDTKKEDLKKVRHLAQLWETPEEEQDIEGTMRISFQPEPVRPLSKRSKRWDSPLSGLSLPAFAVGRLPGPERTEMPDPEMFVFWIQAARKTLVEKLSRAAAEAEARWDNLDWEAQKRLSQRTPRVVLVGPGTETLEPDPDRRVAILRLGDIVQAAWDGDLLTGLRRRVRSQLRLTAFSPFQTHGALPPGSDLFVGREEEVDFIKSRLRHVSILIVGARRVGKTSLLNHIFYWAKGQHDLQPVVVDLQGVSSRKHFLQAVAGAEADHLSPSVQAALLSVDNDKDPRSYLRQLAGAARHQGQLLIFMMNEIDALAARDLSLLEICRGINDEGLARFLMVGYSVIEQLGSPRSPFFHFAEGNQLGGRAMAPTALSPAAARNLLGLVTSSGLGLHWRNDQERDAALALLLERSYRIPWVLQRYGHLLVEHMEKERRDEIRWSDVEKLPGFEEGVVWQYIENIDYQSLDVRRRPDPASGPGFQLLLFAIARQRYFLGGNRAPIHDSKLRDRNALDLGFTVGEARSAIEESLEELLIRHERLRAKEWLDQLDLGQAMRLLTLTLALEPDPQQSDRFGFLLHIVPLELQRLYGSKDPTLDDLIVRKTIELLNNMDIKNGGRRR